MASIANSNVYLLCGSAYFLIIASTTWLHELHTRQSVRFVSSSNRCKLHLQLFPSGREFPLVQQHPIFFCVLALKSFGSQNNRQLESQREPMLASRCVISCSVCCTLPSDSRFTWPSAYWRQNKQHDLTQNHHQMRSFIVLRGWSTSGSIGATLFAGWSTSGSVGAALFAGWSTFGSNGATLCVCNILDHY